MRDGVTEQEFVFRQALSEDGRGVEYIAHRIFTRAASRIFIEKDPYDPARHQPGDLLLWWTFRARARSLDRVELETRGQTTCPKTGEIFHIRLPAPTDATA